MYSGFSFQSETTDTSLYVNQRYTPMTSVAEVVPKAILGVPGGTFRVLAEYLQRWSFARLPEQVLGKVGGKDLTTVLDDN